MPRKAKHASKEVARAISNAQLVPAKPGEVRNPSGRPKGLRSVTDKLREMSLEPEIVKMFRELLFDEDPTIRLKSWEQLMLRAWGAPIQGVMLKMLTGDEEIPQVPVIGEDGQPIVSEGQPIQGAQFIFDPDDPEQRRRALEVGRLIEALGRKQKTEATSVDVEYNKTTNGKVK